MIDNSATDPDNVPQSLSPNIDIPIKISLDVDDNQCIVDGKVTVTLKDDDGSVYEITRNIEAGDRESILKYRLIGSASRETKASSNKTITDQISKPASNGNNNFHFPSLDSAKMQAKNFAQRILDASWQCLHYGKLPEWLQDNEYIFFGYRPPIPSFAGCFKTIWSLHTETGNIWTHLLGCAIFVVLAVYTLTRPVHEVDWRDKLVFAPFFVGIISCLTASTTFHTLQCHSAAIHKVFNKLDYVGILLLLIGSFIPWLYYSFYCRSQAKIMYMIAIVVLGSLALIVCLWDKFGETNFRVVRTLVFIGLGLFGVCPLAHAVYLDGYHTSFGWLILMAVLYIFGAFLYAARIPERMFPGKCDLLFNSHQLFHLFVVAAAIAHYRGITEMAHKRVAGGWPCQSW